MQYTLVVLVGGNLPEVHDAVKVAGDQPVTHEGQTPTEALCLSQDQDTLPPLHVPEPHLVTQSSDEGLMWSL